jgi:hypothetical protein
MPQAEILSSESRVYSSILSVSQGCCVLKLFLQLAPGLDVLGFSRTVFFFGIGRVYIDTCLTNLPGKVNSYNFKNLPIGSTIFFQKLGKCI